MWVPDLPGADKPDLDRYNEYIFPRWKFDNDSIIVGHSSGAVAVLGILDKLPENTIIHKAICVAGFTDNLAWDALDLLFRKPLNFENIKRRARQIILYHSDDDPHVPLWHGEKLHKLLDAQLIILKGQKHFSVSTFPKYTQFPELLEKMQE